MCFGETLEGKNRKMEKFHSSSKMERKTIEKIRRTQMKELYSKLNSLVSSHHSRVCITPSPLMRMSSHLGVLFWFISNIEYMRISNRSRLERESTSCTTDLHFGCFEYEDRNPKYTLWEREREWEREFVVRLTCILGVTQKHTELGERERESWLWSWVHI